MSVYIDRDQLEEFAMNCVGGEVTMKQIHEFPGVHVPPHGRLIDADVLTNRVGSYMPIKWTYEYGSVVSLNDIEHAPTVIPAEEGE